MVTQLDVEYVRKLFEGLMRDYDDNGNEQIPGVATYLAAAWAGMKMLVSRQDRTEPKGGRKGNER